MSAGDDTRGDRWRPGFASSERRVREEPADEACQGGTACVQPGAFVRPVAGRAEVRGARRQTRALIAEQKRLEALRHGAEIAKRPDELKRVDTMYEAWQSTGISSR